VQYRNCARSSFAAPFELVEVEFAFYGTEAITRLAGPIEADSKREPEGARLFRQFFDGIIHLFTAPHCIARSPWR
jgi:hypothetical protein